MVDVETARTRRSHRAAQRAGEAKKRRWLLVAPAAVAGLLLLLVLIDVAAAAGRIHPGVRIGDVPVGWLSRDRAAARVSEQLGPRLAGPVTVTGGGESWKVVADEIGAAVEPSEAVAAAFQVGRTGTFGERALARAKAWVVPVEIPILAIAVPGKVDAFVEKVAEELDVAARDAAVEVEGTEARLLPAKPGTGVDGAELTTDLLAALVSRERVVPVTMQTVPVRVTDEDAQQALADARKMLSDPATIVYDKDSWEYGAAQVGEWIAFETEEPSAAEASGSAAATDATVGGAAGAVPVSRLVLVAVIASDEVSKTLLPKLGDVGRPAKNASFSVSNGRVSIVPHQDGVGPDIEALAADLTRKLTADGDRVVELRTRRVSPEITTADAKKMGIKERLGTYTTTYESSNKPRVNNIHLLADALDGALIEPGGTFSFNGHVGPRTAAKGYQEANAIVRKNGKLVLEPQLGGGICQIGTTVFNAVFFSGLPVLDRRNHSFYISHYPKGRDATVSWGGPDLKFKNDTDHWVLVKTGYTGGSVTVSLYGTDPGYEVEYTTSAFTNVRPHAVEEIKDPTLTIGLRVIEDGGVDGGTVLVERIVRRGGAVYRKDTFKSVYSQKTETVRVGTKPKVTTPSTPATVTGG